MATRFDLSYEANACRRCLSAFCDRHLAHAHACSSSSSKIKSRHDLVRDVREALAVAAGYSDVCHEPRTCAGRDLERADVDYWDRTTLLMTLECTR